MVKHVDHGCRPWCQLMEGSQPWSTMVTFLHGQSFSVVPFNKTCYSMVLDPWKTMKKHGFPWY